VRLWLEDLSKGRREVKQLGAGVLASWAG